MPKILCLTSNDLNGPAYGAAVRARNVFNLLSRLGEVRIVLAGYYMAWTPNPGPFNGGFELLRAIRFERTSKISPLDRLQHDLNPRFMNTDWLQPRPEDRAWLLDTLPEYDLVWIHGLLQANCFGIWRWPNSVLDVDDIPSTLHRSKLSQAHNLKQYLQLKRQVFVWQRHERTLTERFNALCVCSEPDRLQLKHPEKTFVVPNGFTRPANPVSRQPAAPPRIGFVGHFSHPPNREGIHWFVDKAWPQILARHPGARLRLVGEKSQEDTWPPNQNIDALGWVPDVAAEMAGWSLAVVPILHGGGTRLKIAEAFAYRCPTVATTLGAYGYDVKDGEELLLADDAAKFAEKCSRILAEPALGARLAEQARKRFETNWTWDAQADKVAKVVKSVLSDRTTKLERASQPA